MKAETNTTTTASWSMIGIFGIVVIFSGWVFFGATLVPYLQMITYRNDVADVTTLNASQPILNDTFIFKGDDYAQDIMRGNFLSSAFAAANAQNLKNTDPLLDASLKELEAYVAKHPDRYDYYLEIAQAYDQKAALNSNPVDLIFAEQNYEAALNLAPGRQEIMYPYANNLLKLGLSQESIAVLQKAIEETPTVPEGHYRLGEQYAVLGTATYDQSLSEFEIALNANFNPDGALIKQIYDKFLEHYYAQKDVVRFKIVLARLIMLNPSEAAGYTSVLNSIQTTGVIPTINIVSSN